MCLTGRWPNKRRPVFLRVHPHCLCADPLGRRNSGDMLRESWRSGCLFKVDFKGRVADTGPVLYPKLALRIPWFASVGARRIKLHYSCHDILEERRVLQVGPRQEPRHT